MEHETMEFDVIIVGAGPAGLSSAIRLKQLNPNCNVCILEKGAEVGAHILSGAVFEPRALNELIPDWKERGAPLHVEANDDHFLYLTEKRAYTLPTPLPMRNHGNYIISLGLLCRWLAVQAQQLGVEIYAGFPAAELLYTDAGHVCGVATGPLGLDKQGQPKDTYQPGMHLKARQTVLAEGCRGSLTQEAIKRYELTAHCQPQTYALGIKEVWQISPEQHHLGRIMHSIGWPLDHQTYGGSFLYHLDQHRVAIGFVVGLDYKNPYLSPFEEMQRFKTHPAIKPIFKDATRLYYGARALNEGGFQSIPELVFPGGILVGDSAGFVNVPKIKGSHTAMKSGMVAAEALSEALESGAPPRLEQYPLRLKQSWVWSELRAVRNIRPAFDWGLLPALAYSALETYVLHGKAPWTLKHRRLDHDSLIPAARAEKIVYPKPDHHLTFDRLESLFLSGVNHAENQPCHLKLADEDIPIQVNLAQFDAPEQRYCPAGVYEIVDEAQEPRLQINAQNCIHCKTCDIKDPKQNIQWVPPEGGGGPNYSEM